MQVYLVLLCSVNYKSAEIQMYIPVYKKIVYFNNLYYYYIILYYYVKYFNNFQASKQLQKTYTCIYLFRQKKLTRF